MRLTGFVLSDQFRDVGGDVQELDREEGFELVATQAVIEAEALVGDAQIDGFG